MFCPNPIAWEVVASVLGALGTCIAAGAVFLIANREQSERKQSELRAAKRQASAVVAQILHAAAIYRLERDLDLENLPPDQVRRLGIYNCERYLEIKIDATNTDALDPALVSDLHLLAIGIERDQFNIRRLVNQQPLDPNEPLQSLFRAMNRTRDMLVKVGDNAYEVAHGKDCVPPWGEKPAAQS